MKTKTVDYIILGGGCSALTFASELSKKNMKMIGPGVSGIIKIIKIKT